MSASSALAAPVGQGFNLNASDLRFIFKQIQIAQNHSATATSANRCQTQVGSGPNQVPAAGQGRELPWGLRTVDGSCNNLIDLPGREMWGAADTVFPRLVPASPRGAYANPGTVTDSSPRQVSNLIVDQSPNNPAAVAVAGTDTPAPGDGNTLFIENVATDVGLSAPFNSWFTLFGQFFDHGLDLVSKGGNGTVVMPLASDDPLVIGGRDGNPATTADNVRAGTPMLLTRTTDVADPGNQARNTTTSHVDQNQTYTSHPAHQVFLREFATSAASANRPVETGRLLEAPGGGLATWTDVRTQARTVLGIELSDQDVLNVPLLMTDAYGNFDRGPNGLPLMVKPGAPATPGVPAGLVEGNLATPITTAGAARTDHAFLDDIAHHAVPVGQGGAPLAPDTDPGTGDDRAAGTYDDEMLGAHFVAGDGRANENIGLTTVHHVFHSEHNRLREDIDGMITGPNAVLTPAEAAAWQAVDPASQWGYGERLFQAARFVTEMEYQHLVFEEFGRKVQPLINLFGEGGTGYHTTVNDTISAEFAHAVYRFGHSMLTETVARRTASGGIADVALLDAFLNPPSFLDGGRVTPDQAAGEIVRGMTRQPGNEIDEFVTGALRNNLLGLPLDLASINIARARDTGIPTLNEARRAFFASSNNTALRPYESWADLAFSLRHRESLPNFIAAFGRHSSITGTLDQRRNAAELLVYGSGGADGIVGDDLTTTVNEGADDPTGAQPADAFDFLNSLGAHAQVNGRTVTGVDDIDLWMGGLAEKPMVFGGLLGPTFNFVFEKQMEDLQDGDRFYYLSRTAGLNLLTQLEGNSFSELIMRNTDAQGLPADSFSYPAMVFDVDAIDNDPNSVQDDVATPDWNEAKVLTRMLPSGTIRYGGPEHVVFNGTAGNDRVQASEGDDTIRGNDGDDWMEGGDGVDNLIGGIGDDLLTDLGGDDTLKGGDGDDTLSSGQGFGGDLNQGGRGNDFIIGGNDTTETFAGPGNDFVYAGDAEDTVFGDDGDDWIETGRGPFALAQGDNGAPFQDDPNEPGHDVLDGEGGEVDYDAEGGDDVMLAGPGIQRSEGMRGFDWVTHQGDPEKANSDLDLTGALPPAVETNVDRFDLVEGLSGYAFDDVLRGDDRAVGDLSDGHVLDQAGIDRIAGLTSVLPAGASRFDAGNILLGGGGADLIEGRGGDDVIDGDAQLTVELDVPYKNGTVRVVTSLGAIRADALAGLIDPGGITIVRRIERPVATGVSDTALFSGPRAEYDITENPDGTTTVAHARGTQADGVDTLRNIEVLTFADSGDATAPAAPTSVTAVAGNGQATVSFTAAGDGGAPFIRFEIDALTGGAVVSTTEVAADLRSATVTGLTNGTPYTFVVRAVNAVGDSVDSAASAAVTPQAPNAAPTVTARAPGVDATGVAPADDITATFSEAVDGVSGTTFVIRSNAAPTSAIAGTVARVGTTNQYTLNPAADLAANTTYTVTLTGGATAIRDPAGAPLATTSWSFTTAVAVNAPPTVVAGRVPAPNATGVAVGSNIIAPFSEPVQGVSNTTFFVRSNAAPTTAIAGTLTSNGNTWTLNPTADLAPSTTYTVTLIGGATAIRDLANAPLATSTWSFTTGASVVNAPPTLTARTPAINATGVAVGDNVTATFSEPVTGVTTATFVLRNAAGQTIVAPVTRNGTTNQWILNPNADLLPGTTYTVTLTGSATAIRDLANAPFVTTSWSFSTAAAPIGAPTVTARAPLATATGVAVGNDITATFSEAVQGVNTTTFALRPTSAPTSAPIAGSVVYNATTRVATLNPTAALAGGTSYTVTLTGGPTAIRDLQNTALATTTWSFTTAARAPGAPVIGTAVAGVAGGAITATANWAAPTNDGGSPITGYRVRAQRVDAVSGAPVGTPVVSAVQPATARSFQMTLATGGSYRFTVEAINAVATGAQSAASNVVVAR